MSQKARRFFSVFLFFILNLPITVFTQEKQEYRALFTEGFDEETLEYCLENGRIYCSEKDLAKMLESSTDYRAYIRKRLKEEGLPWCLEYLPIIESSYKPTAKPVNGVSVGMWQFMPNSVKPYMELSEYVDERRDPWISTDAALKKLSENYRTFKDWPLALAAYNCGAGAVSRALLKSEKKTFKDLCENDLIPQHAKVYVPNFCAVADSIGNAEYYGNSALSKASDIDCGGASSKNYFFYDDFDYITVTESVSLKALANELRLDEEVLEKLNLSLIRGVTPPHRTWTLRLPRGTARSAHDILLQNHIISTINY